MKMGNQTKHVSETVQAHLPNGRDISISCGGIVTAIKNGQSMSYRHKLVYYGSPVNLDAGTVIGKNSLDAMVSLESYGAVPEFFARIFCDTIGFYSNPSQ